MSTLTSAHFDLPSALVDGLQARYLQPPRAYHSWSHIEAMVSHFDEVAVGPWWQRPLEVLLAALFHDVVYDAVRKDNEAKSAEVAREVIASQLGGRCVDVNQMAELINLTAQHGRLDAYDQGVAEEYAPHVSGILYRLGLRRFLSKLLAAKHIFLTGFFHFQLDAPARANPRRALAR